MIISQFEVSTYGYAYGSFNHAGFASLITSVEAVSLKLRVRYATWIEDGGFDLTPFINWATTVKVREAPRALIWTRQGKLYSTEFDFTLAPRETAEITLFVDGAFLDLPDIPVPLLTTVGAIWRLVGHWELSLPRKIGQRAGRRVEIPQLSHPARFLIASKHWHWSFNETDVLASQVSTELPFVSTSGRADIEIAPDGMMQLDAPIVQATTLPLPKRRARKAAKRRR
jgi:hypothetical protein